MSIDDQKPQIFHWSSSELRPELKPIVLDYKKWKKKAKNKGKGGKPKYTRSLKDVQRLDEDNVHIAQKTARALSKGIDTYEKERRRSAKKKKDGAIEDFYQNSAKAASTSLKEVSDIPVDLADSLNRLALRKNIRKSLRRASKSISRWPV